METILESINSVLGVIGAFVSLPDGKVGAARMPAGLEEAQIEAARLANQTFEALEASGQRIVEMDLCFAQSRLVLKNLRGGILVILCARNVSLPLLNVTANAAAKKISAELKALQHPRTSADVSTIAPSSASVSSTEEATPENAGPPPEIVEARFFDLLTRELARVMGPPAQLIIEDEISLLKEAREKFPKARAAELVERLGGTIHDSTKRQRFQQAMLEAIRNL